MSRNCLLLAGSPSLLGAIIEPYLTEQIGGRFGTSSDCSTYYYYFQASKYSVKSCDGTHQNGGRYSSNTCVCNIQ